MTIPVTLFYGFLFRFRFRRRVESFHLQVEFEISSRCYFTNYLLSDKSTLGSGPAGIMSFPSKTPPVKGFETIILFVLAFVEQIKPCIFFEF